LWAYRYRLEGRSSARPQVGGFASRAEAQKALRKALDRIGPGHGGAITLAELVEEYLEFHQAGDDREAALAARQSNERARRETDRGPVAEGRLRVAA
jgi:glyoxylase-like metal-dependent hydrolase (beta-lactamase superfamily II)